MRRPRPVSQVALSIQAVVKENPGIHFRGLARAAHVTSAGQLRHHLDRLERQGKVVEVEDGRYKRFFTAGDQDPRLRPLMARFSRDVPRRIAKLLLVHPLNRTELRRGLACADSTLGYHLERMVRLGDLARTRGPNSCHYSLTSEETVRKLLMMQGALVEPGQENEDSASNGFELDEYESDDPDSDGHEPDGRGLGDGEEDEAEFPWPATNPETDEPVPDRPPIPDEDVPPTPYDPTPSYDLWQSYPADPETASGASE
jgi:hypothetical protein